uniref:Protein kinase domain-containing protein n=1 Tax=Macrostomum lignano TaxID=282301 RepID=A0A1I8GXU2_9PLAT
MIRGSRRGVSSIRMLRPNAVAAREEFLIPLTNGSVSPAVDDPTLRRILQRHRCRISFLTVTPPPPPLPQKSSLGRSRCPINFVLPRCRVRVVGEDAATVRRCCRQLESSFPAFANRMSAAASAASPSAAGGGRAIAPNILNDGKLSFLCAKRKPAQYHQNRLLLQHSALRSILRLPETTMHCGCSGCISCQQFPSDACSPYFTQTDDAEDASNSPCVISNCDAVASGTSVSSSGIERLRHKRQRRRKSRKFDDRRSKSNSQTLLEKKKANFSTPAAAECDVGGYTAWPRAHGRTRQMGNAPGKPADSPMLDPMGTGEQATPFSRYYEISKASAREWRSRFFQRLADGIMKDFWSPPPNAEVTADSLEEFVPIDTGYRLPHGHFGIFPLVKYRQTGKLYRMKIHSKKLMRESSMPKCSAKVLTELQILANADNVFILKLQGYFLDYMNIYIVMEDYRAGDLNSALIRSSSVFPGLREAKILSEKEARFLAAQLISAIHYLHSINVMHRDIKPQNVLLKFNGYMVLCDFGFSKLMRQEHRTYSILGTWEFMAPEILRNQGYTYCADFWGYACILHQLVAGCPPYKRVPKTGNGLHFEYRNLMPPVPFIRRDSFSVRSSQYTWEEFDKLMFERQSKTGDRVLTQFWHSTPVQGFKYNSYKAASHSNERDSVSGFTGIERLLLRNHEPSPDPQLLGQPPRSLVAGP